MYPISTRFLRTSLLLTSALLPAVASAHPGHDGGAGFTGGLLHPLSGLDHVLMIAAIGLWAARRAVKQRVILACCLGLFVSAGALAPIPASGQLLETTLALTVIGSGLLLATAARLPFWGAGLLAAAFATVHGLAHGSEGINPTPMYVPGLALSTVGLALVSASIAAQFNGRQRWMRATGMLSAMAGVAMCAGVAS